MLKPGRCKADEQGLFGAAEKVQAPEIAAIDGTGLGETVERANAGREIVQAGEIFRDSGDCNRVGSRAGL